MNCAKKRQSRKVIPKGFCCCTSNQAAYDEFSDMTLKIIKLICIQKVIVSKCTFKELLQTNNIVKVETEYKNDQDVQRIVQTMILLCKNNGSTETHIIIPTIIRNFEQGKSWLTVSLPELEYAVRNILSNPSETIWQELLH